MAPSSCTAVPLACRARSSFANPRALRARLRLHVPVGDAVSKLHNWVRQGAEVVYLSSHRKVEDLRKDEEVLRRYGFPEGSVLHRRPDKSLRRQSRKPVVFKKSDRGCASSVRLWTLGFTEE